MEFRGCGKINCLHAYVWSISHWLHTGKLSSLQSFSLPYESIQAQNEIELVLWFFRQSMIGMTEKSMQLMNLIVQSHLGQYLRMRYELNQLISICKGMYDQSLLVSSSIKFYQVITQIWVLLLGGLGLAGLLDVWVGSLNWWIILIVHMDCFSWTSFLSFPGRAWLPCSLLPCSGWFAVIIYILRSTSKGNTKSLLSLKWIFWMLRTFFMWLQLKQNGWIGNFALGASYISLPWCVILWSIDLGKLI